MKIQHTYGILYMCKQFEKTEFDEGVCFFMKKILFGIALIFMSMAFVLVGEFRNILIVSEDFETVACAILPIFGFVMSVWGLFEKDK